MSDFTNRWRALWNPDMYHGWGRKRNYFEGWYCKIVDPAEQYAFAIIPGIAFEDDGNSHAFIQVLDGKQCQATYHEFPAADFNPSAQDFNVQIGNNFFSRSKVVLDLPELSGELTLHNIYPWPNMLGAPGIMGWYSFVPFMQCYHGVVSVDHQLEGELAVYGMPTTFTGGKGYMEKDWGTSFPSSWIWTQTNHFEADRQVSFMASVARIPWVGSHFIGYIVGFLLDGRLYRFATYTGAKMKATLEKDTVRMAFSDKRYRVEVEAVQAAGANLASPISGAMAGKVNESMLATVSLSFYDKGRLIYAGTGRNAGLEVAGPVEELLTPVWRR
jgi:tocopherol cyclase